MHTNLMAMAIFIMSAIYPLRWDDDTPPMTDERREELLYETLEILLFTDEQKAALYACLAEQLRADTPRADALKIIKRAIHACQYPG